MHPALFLLLGHVAQKGAEMISDRMERNRQIRGSFMGQVRDIVSGTNVKLVSERPGSVIFASPSSHGEYLVLAADKGADVAVAALSNYIFKRGRVPYKLNAIMEVRSQVYGDDGCFVVLQEYGDESRFSVVTTVQSSRFREVFVDMVNDIVGKVIGVDRYLQDNGYAR